MKALKTDSRLVRNDLIYLITLAFAFCVVGIGWGSLASWDEAYYAVVSRTMQLSGDWIHLNYYGAVHHDKPPLYFWLTSIFYSIGGISEFTSRLTSALSGVGTVIVTYFIGRTLFNRIVGWAGAGILLSSTDYLHYARWATLDVTNLLFFSLAMLFFIKTRQNQKHWIIFWIASALAFMTKGPIIFLLWGMVTLCLIKRKKFFATLTNRYFLIGVVLFLAIVLPWHIASFLSDPQGFWSGYVYKQYIARTSSAVEGHTGNYYYYIRTMINKYHPWIFLVPIALPWMIWQTIRSNTKFVYGILLFWILTVFCFFTFGVKTKLQWYILPLHPAISLCIAVTIYEWFKGRPEWVLKCIIPIILIAHIPFSSVMVQDYAKEIKAIAPVVKEFVQPDERVFLYIYHEEPAAIYYFDRKVQYIDTHQDLEGFYKKYPSIAIVIHTHNYNSNKKFLQDKGFDIVTRVGEGKNELLLISNQASLSK